MPEYPLRMVEAMAANGCSMDSIEDFIEGRTHLSEAERSALRLLASAEVRRENRRRRRAALTGGERQLAGRVDANDRVDCSWAEESVAGRHQFGLGIGS